MLLRNRNGIDFYLMILCLYVWFNDEMFYDTYWIICDVENNNAF